MNVIVDTSSTINLYNGGLLELVLGLSSFSYVFHMGLIVKGECGELGVYLDRQAIDGRLVFLEDPALSVDEFTSVLELYDLGPGETECIALAKCNDFTVCTDDKAARKAAASHLGAERVCGSLALIRECVCRRRLSSHEALVGYETMKLRGAFLPALEQTYFDC